MELALSLGNRGGVVENNNHHHNNNNNNMCMGLSSTALIKHGDDNHDIDDDDDDNHDDHVRRLEKVGSSSSSDPTADISPRQHQLDLLPFSPLPLPRPSSSSTPHPPPPLRFPWLSDHRNLSSEPGSSDGGPGARVVEVNRRPEAGAAAGGEEGDDQSSPNSGTSSFMEFSLYTSSGGKRGENDGGGGGGGGGGESNNNDESGRNYMQQAGVVIVGGGGGGGATTSRGSDDDENGSTRKKLRLSKEQSAFLEESFKEHHTLNPKQKQALAKQLNLRPRQVEVWFQNRRARTKLKQTEVDCEYLKRCCETLTEENRRLQKELQELRALKTSQPFFMQLPATTLTMCPSCERVAPTSTSSVPASAPIKPVVTVAATSPTSSKANADNRSNGITSLSLGKPFSSTPPKAHQAAS